MINYKMTIGYDGRRYKGYRKTKANADKTIQGKLEAILKKRYEEDIEVISAVNTDAGVNATDQVINFSVPDQKADTRSLREYFDQYLPDDIVTYSVEVVNDRFHSRYNVQELTYEYRIWKKDAPARPLFERQRVNRVDAILDVEKMRHGAELFLGEHEFLAFSTKAKVNSSVKTVTALDIHETENEIIISISADGFLLNMERIIVGTLIQIGLGERHEETIKRAFKSMNNKDAGHKAMASALTLVNVEFK